MIVGYVREVVPDTLSSEQAIVPATRASSKLPWQCNSLEYRRSVRLFDPFLEIHEFGESKSG